MTRILSAFPGTGKTYLFNHPPVGKVILDSDSSLFSWLRPGVRDPKFLFWCTSPFGLLS